VIALGITAAFETEWLVRMYRGMAALARASQCAIAGGDVTRASDLTIAVTVSGHVRPNRMRLRSGAKPGDIIAVTGPLGRAAAGLRIIDRGLGDRLESVDYRSVSDAYLRPRARLREGMFLGGSSAVHAMMDISDGLSTDLARMATASEVDAVVDRRAIALDRAVCAAASLTGDDSLKLALDGGDDYELLVAIQRRAFPHVARGLRSRCGVELAKIGSFERGAGNVWLEDDSGRTPLPRGGYDHFNS